MEQRSSEWFEMRKKYIGASDSAAILGVSPWKTALDVFNEKTSPYTTVSPTNPWMQRGIDLEPEALRAFEKETGYLMAPAVLVSPKHEFMLASLDGLEIDGKAAVEIKCPGIKDHEKALDGQIPEKYIPQLQHQLEVTGLDKIYYFSYNPTHVKQFYIIELHRDEAYVSKLVEAESIFYYNHMLTGIPPDSALNTPKLIESDVWRNLSEEYKRLDRQEKEAIKRKEEIKDLLIQVANSENARGNGIILQNVQRKGIINYQKIPELKQIDLEGYRNPSTSSWRVTELN